MTTKTLNPPNAADNRLRDFSVGAALLASTAMSGFGVASAFWDGLTRWDPAAFIGLATIGAALAASEVGAVVVAHSIIKDGWTTARSVIFGLCTVGNVLAGHFGAEAINTRLVAPARAPYEIRLQSANASVQATQNGLDAFNTRAAGERAELENALEAERAAAPGAVTARGRDAQRQRDSLRERQQAERERITTELTAAQREQAQATAAMHEAPSGFGIAQMWGFALLLELLKGVLVWATSPRRRRIRADGNTLPIDPAAYRDMNRTELEEILSRGRTASALAQHALKRLRDAA